MPNPYEDLFEDSQKKNAETTPSTPIPDPIAEQEFEMDGTEPLDEVLESIEEFNILAEQFSRLLSTTNAMEHKVEVGLSRLLFESQDKYAQPDLKGERQYHALLQEKFTNIIAPMSELAKLHLQTVQQFNRDIDKNYYSIEKTDRAVKIDKSNAINGINLQRKILADATSNLKILSNALLAVERRIRQYINAGGNNNISSAEYELLVDKRRALTTGKLHQFDYTFFNINLLDKTAISLGIYMKELTAQYLNKLLQAFD